MSGCMVEIVSRPGAGFVVTTQGEFDATINEFAETNIVEICPDTGEIPVFPE